MTIEQLVTDEAVELVFAGAYIGPETKRGVIAETLQKVKDGWGCGSTAYYACVNLGLILEYPEYRDGEYDPKFKLSITGKKYLELLKEAENENKAD